jgi:hypothetical protein
MKVIPERGTFVFDARGEDGMLQLSDLSQHALVCDKRPTKDLVTMIARTPNSVVVKRCYVVLYYQHEKGY